MNPMTSFEKAVLVIIDGVMGVSLLIAMANTWGTTVSTGGTVTLLLGGLVALFNMFMLIKEEI